MRTAAILPVKRFALAKQRLGETVADPLRQELAQAMVADVLAAVSGAESVELTIVVTNEPAAVSLARERGATVVADSSESGQSAAVSLGLSLAMAEGMQRGLCIPGDCPSLGPQDLDELLLAGGHPRAVPGVVIIPDRHGKGTNGLLLSPCDVIAPSFGPGSCERHRELALRAGVQCTIERPRGLLLDVDTGEDLAVLRRRLVAEPGLAPRTRAVLGGMTGESPAQSVPVAPLG